jgi:hypothetical protein
VEADDDETEEGNGVLGAENAFVVHVDVEEFVERLDVANAPVVRAGGNNAIEAGAAPGGAGRVQTERAVRMSDRTKIDVGAAIARKGNFDARIGLAGDLRSGVEASVDDVAGRFQAAKPAGVNDAARGGLEELDDFAAHAFGDFERRDGEVELIHSAADEFYKKPEKEAAEERDFGPDLEAIRSGVFVEMTNGRMNRVWIETRATERVEIGNQARVGGNAHMKIFVACDALVDTRADAAAFAQRAAQPGDIRFANALAGDADPDLNAALEEKGDQIVDRGAFVNKWRGRGVRSCVGGVGEGRSGIHGSIFSLMGSGDCLAEELYPLK